MSDIQVTKTDTGWIFSKTNGDQKTEVLYTDVNKNGKLDAADKKTVISSGAGDFTTQEFSAAVKSIFEQEQTEESVGDWYKRKITEEQEEARAEAFERKQRAQKRRELEYKNAQLDKVNKKNTFWGKVGNIGTAILGGLGALAGFGFGFTGWQYNGGCWNDLSLRCFSSATQGLEGMSSYMKNQYSGYTNANSWLDNAQTYTGGSDYFSNLAQQQSEFLANQKQQYEDYMATIQETQAQQQRENAAKAAQAHAKAVYAAANEDGAIISDVNKAKINEIYAPSKNPEDYNESDNVIINHIAAYPNIPYDAVDKNNSLENGKLNTQLGSAINDLINDYQEAADEDKEKVMSQENYNTLNSLLQKARNGQLTKDDITKLDNIIKNPTKKQS